MYYREVYKAIRAQPFVPFDVVMSSGDRYPVNHPENLLILKDCVHIPIYTRRVAERQVAVDDYVSASYLHIAAIERVGSAVTPTTGTDDGGEQPTDSLT